MFFLVKVISISWCEGNVEKCNQHAESIPRSTEQVVTPLVADLLCLLPSYWTSVILWYSRL